MPMHNMTFEQATEFAADVDRAAASVDQVLAHWHEAGQSHWTGGDRETGGNDAPAERVAAAFKALHEARKALSQASHELTMHSLTLPTEAAR